MQIELDPTWANLLRRMMSRAPVAGQGQAILNVSVLIVDGLPVLWSKPGVTMLEPRNCDAGLLLNSLAGDEE